MTEVTRRRLIGGSAAIAATIVSDPQIAAAEETVVVPNPVPDDISSPEATPAPKPRLDPTSIPQFKDALVVPPALPPADTSGDIDRYHLAIRQFDQQILPASTGLMTTVWGTGDPSTPESFNYPGFTIEATVDRPVRITWSNELTDKDGGFLPHLLPVDPTLHWANPGGGEAQRDKHFTYREGQYPKPYLGPVPFVVHLHGARVKEESDGNTEAWYLPDATNIPEGYARVGSLYEEFAAQSESAYGESWLPGQQIAHYDNDQFPATLWFHDHTLGLTRLNVYAGPVGFYCLRGGEHEMPDGALPGPAPKAGDPEGTAYYEIPLAIQDRSFNADGSLFYPTSRHHFDGFEGPFIPESDVSPIFNPEVFGDTMVVNGRTWPTLTVEPRRYRFRLLNGCNSRFVILKVTDSLDADPGAPARLPFNQIGTDLGYLPRVVSRDNILLAPAERADCVIDFTDIPVGTELFMINQGPDEPYGGGQPGKDFPLAKPETTGRVMRFVIGELSGTDSSLPVDQLTMPAFKDLPLVTTHRKLALVEQDSEKLDGVGPIEAKLGVIDEHGELIPLDWDHPITERPIVGMPEIWEFHNFTVDAHPIHVHESPLQVIERQPFEGKPRPLEPWEAGYKDTVICYPQEITRVKIAFANAGRYVWHCHVLEHEDHEMMRPFEILAAGDTE